MKIIWAGLPDFTDTVMDEIEVFMNEGFKTEPEGRVFDRFRFQEVLRALFDFVPSAAFLVMDDDGHCHGIFVGVVAPDMVTSDVLGTQLVWRVDDKGHGFGMSLLASFIDWCRDNGATKVIAAGGHGEFKIRLAKKLQDMDFKAMTENWMKEV